MDTEQDLVRKAMEGDERKLQEIFWIIDRNSYAIGLKHLRNVQDADDVVQETRMMVWQSLEKYNPAKGRLATWAAAIARKVAIGIYKRMNTKKRGSGRQNAEINDGTYASYAQTPLSQLVSRESANKAASALRKRIEEGYKPAEILHMSVSGLSIEQIASLHGIPEGTAKSRLHYARRDIINYLEDDPLRAA